MYPALCPIPRGNLFQAPAGMLTSSVQTANLQPLGDEDLMWRKMEGTETPCNSHGESWPVSLPFPFWFNGKDPTVISSCSPDCLSQCPPNAPSCQESCQVWKKEMSLRKGRVWTEASLPLLLTSSVAWSLPTAFVESVTHRKDGGKSKAHSTWLTEATSRCSTWQTAQLCKNHKAKAWCFSHDLNLAQTSDI